MLLLSWAINKIGLEQWRYDKLGSCQEQTKVESDQFNYLLKSPIFGVQKAHNISPTFNQSGVCGGGGGCPNPF